MNENYYVSRKGKLLKDFERGINHSQRKAHRSYASDRLFPYVQPLLFEARLPSGLPREHHIFFKKPIRKVVEPMYPLRL